MQPQQQGYYAPVPAGAPGAYGAPQQQQTYGYVPTTTVVMETVVVQGRNWSSGLIDPCGGPQGGNTCMYVCFCAPCAAGDVAAAAGRSYLMVRGRSSRGPHSSAASLSVSPDRFHILPCNAAVLLHCPVPAADLRPWLRRPGPAGALLCRSPPSAWKVS